MQVIGFNFSKILAEREQEIKQTSINTNIEFLDVTKEEVGLLKEGEAVKISFKYSVTYSETEKSEKKDGEITFEGNIVLAVTKEESKKLIDSWKNKTISTSTQIPLVNLILKKCSPKSAMLADELGIPSPLPLPKIAPKPKE